MVLIADSGSTKASWCLITPASGNVFFETEGYNPFFVQTEYVVSSLNQNIPDTINREAVTEIHFYGSGCVPEKASIIRNALTALFSNSSIIKVESDLLGAARALLGRTEGFAAILGTGTNSCLYDGTKISHNVSSLGFILGDEGSGGYLGKKLLIEYMRGKLPDDLNKSFIETYQITQPEIMERVYRQALPNRFCAGFSKFLSANIDDRYASNLVKSSFYDFFNNLVSSYPGFENYIFNCVGSVAYYFKDILVETASEFNMRSGRILRSPMEGLMDYHSAN
jgi:glucosamine kinase